MLPPPLQINPLQIPIPGLALLGKPILHFPLSCSQNLAMPWGHLCASLKKPSFLCVDIVLCWGAQIGEQNFLHFSPTHLSAGNAWAMNSLACTAISNGFASNRAILQLVPFLQLGIGKLNGSC